MQHLGCELSNGSAVLTPSSAKAQQQAPRNSGTELPSRSSAAQRTWLLCCCQRLLSEWAGKPCWLHMKTSKRCKVDIHSSWSTSLEKIAFGLSLHFRLTKTMNFMHCKDNCSFSVSSRCLRSLADLKLWGPEDNLRMSRRPLTHSRTIWLLHNVSSRKTSKETHAKIDALIAQLEETLRLEPADLTRQAVEGEAKHQALLKKMVWRRIRIVALLNLHFNCLHFMSHWCSADTHAVQWLVRGIWLVLFTRWLHCWCLLSQSNLCFAGPPPSKFQQVRTAVHLQRWTFALKVLSQCSLSHARQKMTDDTMLTACRPALKMMTNSQVKILSRQAHDCFSNLTFVINNDELTDTMHKLDWKGSPDIHRMCHVLATSSMCNATWCVLNFSARVEQCILQWPNWCKKFMAGWSVWQRPALKINLMTTNFWHLSCSENTVRQCVWQLLGEHTWMHVLPASSASTASQIPRHHHAQSEISVAFFFVKAKDVLYYFEKTPISPM